MNEEEIAIETLKEVASDDFDTLGDDISPKMAQNILNVIDKQQKELDFYKKEELGYIAGYEDGKRHKQTAVAIKNENAQQELFQKEIARLKEIIERQQDEIDTWEETENDYEHELARNNEQIKRQQKEIEEKTTILLAGAEKVKQLEKEIEELKEKNIQLTNYLNDSYYVSADKIREKIKNIEDIYKKEMKPYQTEYGLNVSLLSKKEKEELINKRNGLLTQKITLEELLEGN